MAISIIEWAVVMKCLHKFKYFIKRLLLEYGEAEHLRVGRISKVLYFLQSRGISVYFSRIICHTLPPPSLSVTHLPFERDLWNKKLFENGLM